MTRGQRFGEDVGRVFGFLHKRHRAAVDVCGAGVVLGVVGLVDRGHAVRGERGRLGGRQAQLGEKRAQVHGLSRRFGSRDNLGFTDYIYSYRCLRLRRPGHRSLTVREKEIVGSGKPGGAVRVHQYAPRGSLHVWQLIALNSMSTA
eukprot:4418501-Pleurochrysis_carterae.AAC.9